MPVLFAPGHIPCFLPGWVRVSMAEVHTSGAPGGRVERVIRPPAFSPSEVWSSLAALGRHRDLVYTLAVHRIKVRYKQSLLGLGWAVVQPLWKFPWDVLDDSVSLQGNLSEHTAPVWALVGFVVVVGTIITFSLLTGALRHIPATRASIVATLEPVIATGVAWVWLGQSFGTAQLVGGAIVLAGIFLAQSAR